MAANPPAQIDFRGLIATSFDGTFNLSYVNGDKPEVEIDPNALYVGEDGVGSDSPSDGTVGSPFASITYAVSRALALGRETIYVRSGTHTQGADFGNISGFSNLNLLKYPTDSGQAILEFQGLYEGITVISPLVYLTDLVLQNLSGEHGISFEDNCAGGIARRCLVDTLDNPVTNSNAGGFYLGKTQSTLCDNVLIDDCRAKSVSVAGDKSNGNASAIHSYACQNSTVRNFTGHDTNNGLFWKRSTGVGNNTTEKCVFYDVDNGVRSTADGGNPLHLNTVVTESIFYNIALNAIETELSGTVSSGNTGFEISNCVFDAPLQAAILLDRLTNPQVFNNIFYNITGSDWAIDHRDDTTLATDDINRNNYFNASRWIFDRYGGGESQYTALSALQAGRNQENNGLLLDPQFVDAINRDYRVQNSSLLGTGVGGVNYGAYKNGGETIGASV